MGVNRLDEFCLLAGDRADVLRLHDIIGTSVRRKGGIPARFVTEFEEKLIEYIRRLTLSLDDDILFHNFCAIHRKQLAKLAHASPRPAPYLYCLLQSWSPDELPTELSDYPQTTVTRLLAENLPVDELEAYTVIEAIEALYRSKTRGNEEAAKQLYRDSLPLFDALITAQGVTPEAQRRILHHKAKALRILGDFGPAVAICRELLAAPQPSSATKLLLARLLTANPIEVAEAKTLLLELLNEAKTSKTKCEVSVALAAFTELTQSAFNLKFDALWRDFGTLIGGWIVDSAARGLDQAYHTFAVCAGHLQWKDPEQLKTWVQQLPPVPLDSTMSENDRISWGQILIAVAQAEKDPTKAAVLLGEALEFFASIVEPSNFALRYKAKVLNLLQRYAEAEAVFRSMDQSGWTAFEFYEYAKTLEGLGRPEAFDTVTSALAKLRPDQYGRFGPAFLDFRATVGKRQERSEWLDDLQKAHDIAQDEKFKSVLASKLQAVTDQLTMKP